MFSVRLCFGLCLLLQFFNGVAADKSPALWLLKGKQFLTNLFAPGPAKSGQKTSTPDKAEIEAIQKQLILAGNDSLFSNGLQNGTLFDEENENGSLKISGKVAKGRKRILLFKKRPVKAQASRVTKIAPTTEGTGPVTRQRDIQETKLCQNDSEGINCTFLQPHVDVATKEGKNDVLKNHTWIAAWLILALIAGMTIAVAVVFLIVRTKAAHAKWTPLTQATSEPLSQPALDKVKITYISHQRVKTNRATGSAV